MSAGLAAGGGKARAVGQGRGIRSGVERKANPPTSFFTVREKMGWDVVVKKPAWPKRSAGLAGFLIFL